MLDKYSIDSIRYYFIASANYGTDINFSESSLITMHNSELADTLGNLVHRALTLGHKYCNGMIPDVSHDIAFPLPFDVSLLINEVSTDATQFSLNTAIFKTMDAVRATNR